MLENQKIPFNFTYFAMKLLGKNLYSNPWTAVSEIVANGIDAGAKNVYVLIDMRNKEKAIVEIFDNGAGMSIDDLREKYTLIGRNKRLDSENKRGKTLGRKGIGKLAALYLSPRYYLYTKNKANQTAWMVNTQGILDSQIPALVQVEANNDRLISKEYWGNLNSGTMIHLSDVDLRKIGPERLKSLPAMLADYYLDTVIDTTISVCVIDRYEDEIKFETISKNINFDTMYGIFDNTGLNYKNKIQDAVFLTKPTVDAQVDYPRKTVKIDETKYNCEGDLPMTNLRGKFQNVHYKMVGWIGIHSSLDNLILMRNSKGGKKIQNHPNALRLYVRGKLAVNNLMNYIGSTAAFASYIEGEISFDALDDDMFEDASTSNREGYSINDPRIKKLIEIVNRIISALIFERNKIGNTINLELKAIEDAIKKAEEEAKKKALEAEKEKLEAEKKAEEEKQKRIKSEQERDTTKKQFYFLEKQLSEDDKTRAYNTHVIKNNANNINDNLVLLLQQHPECKQFEEIRAISISDQKILTAVKYYNKVNYGLENKVITGDLSLFIKQYIEEVIILEYLMIKVEVDNPVGWVCSFSPQDLTVALENIFSNANKAGANRMRVTFARNDAWFNVKFINNGKKLCEDDNKDQLFEFGYSTSTSTGITIGTGIGLYQIKELFVEDLGGNVDIYNNEKEGITLEIKLYEA